MLGVSMSSKDLSFYREFSVSHIAPPPNIFLSSPQYGLFFLSLPAAL